MQLRDFLHGRVRLASRVLTALGAVALVGGCATRGGDIPYAPAEFVAPDQETRGALAQDMALGPLDELKVTVFRVPDLSGDYQVGGDGYIALPLIGRVDVRNRTADQLATDLESSYGSKYLNNPDVSVRVVKSNQRSVVVEGGVREPGIFPLAGSSTLLGAIALARGVDAENGNPKRVAIFRKVNGRTMAAAFDLIDIRRGKMENPAVYPGDTVVVDGGGLRAIYKDILQVLPTAAVFATLR